MLIKPINCPTSSWNSSPKEVKRYIVEQSKDTPWSLEGLKQHLDLFCLASTDKKEYTFGPDTCTFMKLGDAIEGGFAFVLPPRFHNQDEFLKRSYVEMVLGHFYTPDILLTL